MDGGQVEIESLSKHLVVVATRHQVFTGGHVAILTALFATAAAASATDSVTSAMRVRPTRFLTGCLLLTLQHAAP